MYHLSFICHVINPQCAYDILKRLFTTVIIQCVQPPQTIAVVKRLNCVTSQRVMVIVIAGVLLLHKYKT